MNGKPVMFDDTVNFISINREEEAKFVFELITSQPSKDFLSSMIFWDEKRPITTKVLRELSIKTLAEKSDLIEQYLDFIASGKTNVAGQLSLGIAEKASEYRGRKSS